MDLKLITEEANFEGVDDICCSIEHLTDIPEIGNITFTSFSAPL